MNLGRGALLVERAGETWDDVGVDGFIGLKNIKSNVPRLERSGSNPARGGNRETNEYRYKFTHTLLHVCSVPPCSTVMGQRSRA